MLRLRWSSPPIGWICATSCSYCIYCCCSHIALEHSLYEIQLMPIRTHRLICLGICSWQDSEVVCLLWPPSQVSCGRASEIIIMARNSKHNSTYLFVHPKQIKSADDQNVSTCVPWLLHGACPTHARSQHPKYTCIYLKLVIQQNIHLSVKNAKFSHHWKFLLLYGSFM